MYFLNSAKKEKARLKKFLSIQESDKTFDELTSLQNEINTHGDSSRIIIAGINDDYLAATFSKAFADAYVIKGKKVIIFDANFYEPQLTQLLNIQSNKVERINKNESIFSFDRDPYPTEKNKIDSFLKTINSKAKSFDYTIVVAPNTVSHKDILLLAGKTDHILLVSRRDVTERKAIFNSLKIFEDCSYPTPEVIVVK